MSSMGNITCSEYTDTTVNIAKFNNSTNKNYFMN